MFRFFLSYSIRHADLGDHLPFRSQSFPGLNKLKVSHHTDRGKVEQTESCIPTMNTHHTARRLWLEGGKMPIWGCWLCRARRADFSLSTLSIAPAGVHLPCLSCGRFWEKKKTHSVTKSWSAGKHLNLVFLAREKEHIKGSFDYRIGKQ